MRHTYHIMSHHLIKVHLYLYEKVKTSINQIEYYVCYKQSKCNIHLPVYELGLGLWCFTPLSTIVHLYHGGQFYYYKNTQCLQKTINLSQVTDKFITYCYIGYISSLAGFELTTYVMKRNNCTSS